MPEIYSYLLTYLLTNKGSGGTGKEQRWALATTVGNNLLANTVFMPTMCRHTQHRLNGEMVSKLHFDSEGQAYRIVALSLVATLKHCCRPSFVREREGGGVDKLNGRREMC